MGVTGGEAPHGLTRREASTFYLRAPYRDWASLANGWKTEFRTPSMGVRGEAIQVPTPVVLYCTSLRGRLKSKLMVLATHRRERLLDISEQPDALVREGFETYDQFRDYWRRRTHRPYRALDKVEVFGLAPWPDHQLAIDQLGRLLLERLYGEHTS